MVRVMTRRDTLRMIGGGLMAGAASAEEKSSPVLVREIPSSGEALPVIGMGTWQTFDVDESGRAAVEEVLRAFVELGGKLLDSSPMYGKSEQVAGDLTAKLGAREKLFVATKVWISGRGEGISQMEASMKKLRTDSIDLMQVHNLVDVATHLDTLRGWKKEGRVRYLGVTHYTASQHDAVAKWVESGGLDFIQINYSAGEREADRRLLPLAADKGVAVIANRPFAGGGLLRKLLEKPLPGWAGEIGCTSWAQVLLKFVVSHPAITCAIPATSKERHLRDNMKAGRGPLPDEALRERILAAIV